MACWSPSAKVWFIPTLSLTKTELNAITVLVKCRSERKVIRGSKDWVEFVFPRNIESSLSASTGVD